MIDDRPLILAISSACRDIEVALMKGDSVLSEHLSADAGSEGIMGYADMVLKASGRSIEEVSLVAVTIGPGSYGRLRGGLASAKGVAQSRGIPLIEVPTLEAIAYNMSGVEGLVVVASPAMKDEYNLALFGCHGGSVKTLTDDFVLGFSAISKALSKIKGGFYLLCPGSDLVEEIKRLNPGSKVAAAASGSCFPKASFVGALGFLKFLKGRRGDVLTSSPRYSHDPRIREFKAKEAA